MEPADWVNFVEIEQKHDQLMYRPYGPLGHNKPPLRVVTQFQTGYSANFAHVSDPVFDSFYPRAAAATNEDELKQVIRDANEHVARQHYAVSLLLPLQYSLYQPWVKGVCGAGSFGVDGFRRPQHVEFLRGAVLDRPGSEKEFRTLNNRSNCAIIDSILNNRACNVGVATPL